MNIFNKNKPVAKVEDKTEDVSIQEEVIESVSVLLRNDEVATVTVPGELKSNTNEKALVAEAIELFSKMLKGYPVSDKVKVWVEKASKGE